ncbi:hypothetical protein MAR_030689 [Mya arenaria]|uniref:Uncharacterized protein n=1 Tax=Mya arenaria TaxID=6604 RepID=A0ABY7F1N7_MYAAR|nr:hypothetical protein MAR_030689 [Mya arenaria]
MKIFGIIICSSSLVEGFSYADEVRDIFRRHFNNEDNECWERTNTNQYTDTIGMAKALVNVYTQECKNFNNKKYGWSFYRVLNDKLRGRTNEPIWLDTEDLLNRALSVLGLQTGNTLFRACQCSDIKKGYILMNYDFWSTSLDASQTTQFLSKDKIFFKLTASPAGTYIDKYSAFPEKEVLLQSKSQLYVEEYITDTQEIEAKTNELKLPTDTKMKAFAVVTGNIPPSVSGSALNSGKCDCSGGTTSGASMPTSFLSALFFIALTLVW